MELPKKLKTDLVRHSWTKAGIKELAKSFDDLDAVECSALSRVFDNLAKELKKRDSDALAEMGDVAYVGSIKLQRIVSDKKVYPELPAHLKAALEAANSRVKAAKEKIKEWESKQEAEDVIVSNSLRVTIP